MKNRILSLALAICMLLSAMPVSHAGILSSGGDDLPMQVEQPVEGGILSLGDAESVAEPVFEEQFQQGILSAGDGEEPQQEPSQSIFADDGETSYVEQPSEGILSITQPEGTDEEPQFQPKDQPGHGLLVVQCGECGYLDNNHAKDCPVIAPAQPVITVPVATDEERKPAIVYSDSYMDTYAQLLSSETLEDFEDTLDLLTADQQDELFELLTDDEQDALAELEDTLTRQAIADQPQKTTVKKIVTTEQRTVAFGAAHRAALKQLGYELIVNFYGRIVEFVDMLASSYTVLETVTPAEDADYQWQILADDVWVDIQNETAPQIRVSYAMVASLLDRHDTVELRCEIDNDGDVTTTDPVEVCVEYDSDDVIIDARDIDEDESDEEELPEEELPEEEEEEETPAAEDDTLQLFDMPEMAEELDDSIMLMAEEDGESQELEIYNVTIYYRFEDGTLAADPYGSTIGKGHPLTGTVEHPHIQGYEAHSATQLPDDKTVTFDKKGINFSIAQMSQNITITVTMVPAMVKYTVLHYKQNINNDNYYLAATDQREALTGSTIGEVARIIKDEKDDWKISIPADSKDTVEEWMGFYPYQYEKPTVAADGSTVVEIYYDRYYYLMSFDLGENAYGTEPIYARYEAALGTVPTPTREGYTFMGWSLDGEKIVTLPSTMPAENRRYTAIWGNPKQVNYTVVYWKENTNDSNYSFWGSEIKRATAGSTVSGSDSIPTSITTTTVNGEQVNERPYFTFNLGRTDQNIVISGDGTSVVNVYYYRNVYTIYFRGYGKCALEVHSHSDDCYTVSCGLESHTHDDDCVKKLKCTIPEHTAHTDSCLTCGKTEHIAHTDSCLQCTHTHTHTINCFTTSGNSNSNVTNNDKNTIAAIGDGEPQSGYVYVIKTNSDRNYYMYLRWDGNWYRLSATDELDERYIETTVLGTGTYRTGGTTYTATKYKAKATRCTDNHTHTNACYKDELHSHITSCYKDIIHAHTDACYAYSCGLSEHTHTSACDRLTCTTPVHSHSSYNPDCNANSGNNVIHVITAKYEQDISAVWPTYDVLKNGNYAYEDSSGNVENASGDKFRGWNLNLDAEAVSKRVTMTADLCDTSDNIKEATAQYGASYTYHLYYMFESFDQTSAANGTTRKNYGGKYYDSDSAYYQVLVYSSDTTFGQKQITGMTPVGTSKDTSGNKGSANYVITNWLYYDRNRVTLTYQNVDEEINTVSNIMYGQPLASYTDSNGNLLSAVVPEYPETLEPNAFVFDGWYTTPECFEGTQFNFATATMPNNDLTLYAKWAPISHTVKFYLDQNAYQNHQELDTHPQQTVPHGSTIAVENPKNGDFIFVGWFYMDNGVEKAYDFANMPVRKDLEVYAKWSSKIMMNYIVYYRTQDGAEISVAHPVAWDLSGSAIAGSTKTFVAKGGNDLFEGYRNGYFPTTTSHSIVIETNKDKNDWYTVNPETGEKEQGYIFWYVKRDAVPYLVRYVDENGNELLPSKVVSDNHSAIVTANFVVHPGYMPDAYQKQLVVNGSLTLESDQHWIEALDKNGATLKIHPDNVITFVYKKDEKHAYYREIHHVQTTDGKNWMEYASAEKVGDIGTEYTIEPLNIVGYTLDTAVTGTVQSGKLTAEGMVLKLYYKRNLYPYEVRYLEQNTGKQLAEPKRGEGLYQQQIPESAIPIDGYVAVAPNDQTVYIRIESGSTPQLNVITFYYVVAQTSLTINKTWDGAECYGQDAIFTVSGGELSGLQVVIPYKQGGNSVTITGLKVGTKYTVTEDVGWSWRFTPEGAPEKASKPILLAANGNVLYFANELNSNKIYWFDDSDHKRNRFGDPNS